LGKRELCTASFHGKSRALTEKKLPPKTEESVSRTKKIGDSQKRRGKSHKVSHLKEGVIEEGFQDFKENS